MGIKDLLRFMKPYILPIHIQKYAGTRVGIDAYSWLHKGAYSCSMELCLDTDGKKKLRYIDYFMDRINLLQHYEITPVVVLDGGRMPCKAATGDERQRKRKANFDAAMAKLKEGNVGAAVEFFQRAVSVTSSMAHQLIQVLKSENVEFIVAPYEADAQLAYLSSLELEQGGIAAVITEDSDLLAYGCKAVIFKMDRYGKGEELILDNVFQAVDQKPSFQNFDQELFTAMCVLAGCDFLPSVPGVGISRAHGFISKYQSVERVLSVLKTKKGKLVPDDYSNSLMEAVSVFQYARVYDFHAKKLKHLKPLSQNLVNLSVEELEFLGPDLSPSVAAAIAEGNVDPITMEAFNRFSVSERQPKKPVPSFKEQEKGSSFLLLPLSESEERINLKRSAGEAEIGPETVLEAPKYFKQDLDLHKLMLPQPDKDHMVIRTSNPSPAPDNNPFKIRRKTDEIKMEEYDLQELKVSFETNGEAMDVTSRKEVTIDLSKLDDSVIKQDSEENIEKKRSVDSKDVVEIQGHANMTTKRVRGAKPRAESFKVKTSYDKKANKINKKSSILDFFHPL
ncbi:5'-3' exonuclease family protein [Raphanus sativus]|uniref:Exonuclease 1 n=2 Tax=Raphanus sativus TaxID=3726 RepID=A0A9W3CXK4_RAPSA|nr:exonuclease 1-like [Raphanus sativus]KAJ4867945.1 5'-3' exonuclease family protein [Raphanus sativus]